MKPTNWLVKLALVLAIIGSVALSVLIWTNNQRYERRVNSENTTTASAVNHQSFSTTYLPTQIVVTNAKSDQKLVYNHQDNLMARFREQLIMWRFSKLTLQNYQKMNYQKALLLPNSVQLIYTGAMSLNIFGRVINQKKLQQRTPDVRFNRLVLATTTRNRMYAYFLNDQTHQVYRARVTRYSSRTFANLMKAYDSEYPVTLASWNNHEIVYFNQKITLPYYSYLITKRSAASYLPTLFNSTSENVESRESEGQTIYYYGIYRRLAFDHTKDQVSYDNYQQTFIPSSEAAIFQRSYTTLTQIGNSLGDIRYFDYDASQHNVTFRHFAESFPIFKTGVNGALQVRFSTNGETVEFSNQVLQVPLPANGKSATLPSTETVLSRLLAAGLSKAKLDTITVGYDWQTDSQHRTVINLVPTYFVKYNGSWTTYQQLLAQSPTS